MKGLVLIVDDAVAIREYLRDLLHMLGYEVVEATNGLDGLAKLTEITPVLIILDMMMPEMDGVTFFHELQRQALSYPLLACSGSDTVHHFAQQINAIGYLAKPFHISQVLNTLSEWRRTSEAE